MDTIWQDIRFALRIFVRQPGFVAITVLTLALGIGANSAMFSVVNSVLLKHLPFPDAEELVMVWLDNPSQGIKADVTSYPNFEDTRDQSRLLSDLGAFSSGESNLSVNGGEPERLRNAQVMANVFDIVGVEPVLGRSFVAEEDFVGPEPVVILSDAIWQRRFGGAESILGETLRLDGIPHTVVGVMPPGFEFPGDTKIWLPLALDEQIRNQRYQLWLHQIGRRAPGASLERVRLEMDTIGARITQEHNLPGYGIHVESLRDHLVGEARSPLLVLLAAVAFVLLIACGNVVHLLLARAAAREREVVIRSALGAGRGRLMRQMLTESALLAALGGGLALVIAQASLGALVRLGPATWTRLGDIALDGHVLLFTFLVSVLAGFLVGVVPAFQASRLNLAETLKEGGRGSSGGPAGHRVRRALVMAEVALTLVLLVGASLLVKSLDRVLRTDPGFHTEGLLLVDLALQRTGYEEPEAVHRFYHELLERSAALPGVKHAGAGSSALLPEQPWSTYMSIEGQPDGPLVERLEIPIDGATPGFFEALGVDLRDGRPFTDADRHDVAPVTIINEAMAQFYWSGESAMGKRLKYGNQGSRSPWMTVVGVVTDARRRSLVEPARPSIYVPHGQDAMRRMTVVLQGDGELNLLIPAVRDLVRELDPGIPLAGVAKVEDLLADQLSERRFTTWMLGGFSGLALFLALVGVYGVISHAVASSLRELGVRLALGATPGEITKLVIRQGLRPVFAGLLLGVPLALLLSRLLASLLFEVSTFDPAIYLVISVLLIGVSIIAAYLPARRASAISPTEVLRND
jgi:putative ABC transport system permease protein